MREMQDRQLRLEFYQSDSKMSKKLEKASVILEKDESFLEKIAEDFKTKRGSKAGAKGMTIEQVIRIAILKQMSQLSYDKLYDELSDNISYRRFAKIHDCKVPKKTALNENIKRISASSIEELNKVIIKVAMELKVEYGKTIRMDSTGVESNIHYPTDGELLWDCVRVIDRIMEEVIEVYPDIEFGFSNHTKRAKRRRYKIVNTSSKEKRNEAYKDLLQVSEMTLQYTKSCIEQLEKVEEIEAGIYKATLQEYLESLRVIMNQTEENKGQDNNAYLYKKTKKESKKGTKKGTG